ncbi:MAG: peptidoglycan-binding protein LysM [Myxococcota bacterium]
MGLFSFIQSAGEAIGLVESEESKQAKIAEAAAQSEAAAQAAREAQAAADREFAEALKGAVARQGLNVQIEAIAFHAGVVTMRGTAQTNADREKAVLTVGNVNGVSQVHEALAVTDPEPESTLHTVEKGDLLSKIAGAHYGDVMLYNLIFEANRPMLSHPDKIYPGQVLRVPAAGSYIMYTVESGDTLGKVAKHYYQDASKWTEIQAANGMDGDGLDVGQALRLPVPQPKQA